MTNGPRTRNTLNSSSREIPNDPKYITNNVKTMNTNKPKVIREDSEDNSNLTKNTKNTLKSPEPQKFIKKQNRVNINNSSLTSNKDSNLNNNNESNLVSHNSHSNTKTNNETSKTNQQTQEEEFNGSK